MDRSDAPTDSRLRSRPLVSVWLLILVGACALLLSVLTLWFGELNQDEGWYLYSARQVLQGRYPFVHAASTQGPVMSFVYAALWGPLQGMGLLGGRVVTAVLGWVGIGLAALLAWRLGGEERSRRGVAAFVAFTLIGINIYQAYFTAIVKTYALGSLLLLGAFVALTSGGKSRTRQHLWAVGAGILFALAAGTRISLLMFLPVVFIWLWVMRYRKGQAACPWSLALGAGVTLLVLFGPLLYAAPQALWFGMVEYHAGREAGSWGSLLAYKVAFVLRTLRAYLIPVALLLWAGIRRMTDSNAEIGFGRVPLLVPMAVGVGIVTLVHFMAPFPYDDYQVVIFPLFAVVVGVGVSGLLAGRETRWLLVLLCAMVAFSSPRLQDLFAAPRDRIWWPMRTQSPLAQLQEVASQIQSEVAPNELLLTQDIYLAVEAEREVPEGMEMGPFCYFPEMSDARARACHVLNRDMLTEVLQTSDAPLAALSDYGLAIASPSVQPIGSDETARLRRLVEARYTLIDTIPAFGQAQTPLRLYRLRSEL